MKRFSPILACSLSSRTRRPGDRGVGVVRQPSGSIGHLHRKPGLPGREQPWLQHSDEVAHRRRAGLQRGRHPPPPDNRLGRRNGARVEHGFLTAGQPASDLKFWFSIYSHESIRKLH